MARAEGVGRDDKDYRRMATTSVGRINGSLPQPSPPRFGQSGEGGGGGHRMQWRRSLATTTLFFLKFACSLMLTCCGFESNAFVLQVYNVCDWILFLG